MVTEIIVNPSGKTAWVRLQYENGAPPYNTKKINHKETNIDKIIYIHTHKILILT